MRLLLSIFVLCLVASCTTTKQIPTSSKKTIASASQVYRGSYTMLNDLVHTRLELRPDWEEQRMAGKATVTLHPHFHPTDSVTLNARGMFIHRVAMIKNSRDTVSLDYSYDSLLLRIKLDTVYAKERQYTLFIDYTARPQEIETGGSAAIREDKGLYFINPDGADTEKPRQIWSQGETESNSVWFPTIEDPQQRMTQEIYLTVDSMFETLSNGKLIQTSCNIDGSRTDYWKQSLPCPPYLTMIAVGDFAVVNDAWRNLPVDYYVEHEYELHAMEIFGHTPEMMDLFSKKFGVEYPWEKYSQMPVRDYVSGAMENTTAVIHRHELQQTSRERLDYNYEDYISHELTHHWFGDLVTCESWSNIVLNEGFATYGEYIWREYKYGRDDADYANQKDQNKYLYAAPHSDADVVRFHYTYREEVYDAISYDKGGRILHMLRKYLGDDAFYASMKYYLEQNKFSAVEVHDLRLAFEKISGEDLNWFFNQWYLNKGYPRLSINYAYNDSTHSQQIIIEQTQPLDKNPLFRLPLEIDIYSGGKTERHSIVVEKANQSFAFNVPSKPDLVNVDAEKMLLCTKKDNKPREQYIYQYYHAPLYLDRYEAVNKFGDEVKPGTTEAQMLKDALKDRFWVIRNLALKNLDELVKVKEPGLREEIERLAKNDPKSQVRSTALRLLSKNYYDTLTEAALLNAINDSSYLVIETAFIQLKEKNKNMAAGVAPRLEKERSDDIMQALAEFYGDEGDSSHNEFFLNSVKNKKPKEQNYIIEEYGNYLAQQDFEMRERGIVFLDSLARKSQPWYIRLAAMNSMSDLQDKLTKRASNASDDKQVLTPTDVEKMKRQAGFLKEEMNDIRQKETNKKLLDYYKK